MEYNIKDLFVDYEGMKVVFSDDIAEVLNVDGLELVEYIENVMDKIEKDEFNNFTYENFILGVSTVKNGKHYATIPMTLTGLLIVLIGLQNIDKEKMQILNNSVIEYISTDLKGVTQSGK